MTIIEGTTDRDLAVTHAESIRQVAEKQGHDLVSPMIHFRREGETDILMLLAGAVPGMLYDVVQEAISSLPWAPTSVVLMHDGYCERVTDLKEMEDVVRRSLGTRFAAGDPSVRECLTTILMARNVGILVQQRYTWTPEGGWEWDDIEVLDSSEIDAPTNWEWERLVTGLPRRPMEAFMRGNE